VSADLWEHDTQYDRPIDDAKAQLAGRFVTIIVSKGNHAT